MIEVTYTIAENALIASGVYRLRLEGDTSAITAPGQFLDLRLPGFFLRRPISICDWDEKSITLLYKVVGGGTDWLSRCTPGQALDALSGLGNGFDVATRGETTLLAGGGSVSRRSSAFQSAFLPRAKRPSPFWVSTLRRMFFTKMNSRRSACRLSSQRRTVAAVRAAL